MNLKRKSSFYSLPPDKLRWRCPPEKIPFESTEDCSPCDEIIGQDRAIKAIQTGLEVKSVGYNIFITGMVGTGRTTAIKQLLEKLQKMEKEKALPPDLLYVNNFKNPDEPILLQFPAGQGRLFRQAMTNLIEMITANIPELLKSRYYTERKEAIVEAQQKKQREILERFEAQVAEEGFSVIQVQMGLFVKPDLVPLIEGRPVSFTKLEALVREKKFSAEELEKLKKKYEALSAELEKIFEELREIEEETRNLLKNWDAEAIAPIISGAINEIRTHFPYSGVEDYLTEVEKSLMANLDLFKEQKKEERERESGDPFLPYRVNLLVDNAELKEPPVIIETNPTYSNLFGSIEVSLTRTGLWQTDFTKIKAGSFVKANGGYLVMNALDAIIEPGVWTTLKRSLRYQQLEIQNYPPLLLISTTRLKPQPIPCQVKVVMIGDAPLYDLLYYLDEDFKKIFKVKAEFDSEMLKTDKAIIDYARFIRKIVDEDKLLPFDREGIAAVIEYGVRLAGRQKKMSTRFHILADVIREADFWARKEGSHFVTRHHVDKAIEERFERISLIEDKIQEMIEDGLLLIDTQGEVIGQVNGLAVYQLGEFAFGKPTRITARTAVGRGGVINIEREAALGGAVYNKGVLILSGYLMGKYAQDKPFSLTATVTFEQSYTGVDGDSASSTEVYAILSSLAKLPLRQDIAVTGSLNQKGEIQPIGGVNEKIEGFFDVCRAKGLTGTQGVIIPHQNVQNLMLRRDVIEAVEKGLFHIYPIKTIDEGIEILTGVEAGQMREDGTFEEGTVNYLVDRELRRLAESWRAFAGEKTS